MSSNQVFALLVGIGYVVGVIASFFYPAYLALIFPALMSFIGLLIHNRDSTSAKTKAKGRPLEGDTGASAKPLAEAAGDSASSTATAVKASEPMGASASIGSTGNIPIAEDPLWGPVLEYIGVIEDMIISEGQKNNLDNEIVEKTLSLLSRLGRVIPQLQALNDGNINHNIHRLVFKDLNGAVNPFLRLSGEAKQQNRRLLLTGLKDINSKISFYVESIEQRDLIDLQTKVELIQQRYNSRL
jgi:hypothetical protein